MGYGAPKLSRQEVAEAISDTDTYYTVGGKEFTIDTAFYRRGDGTIGLEGYIEDEDGDKHYLEVYVTVDRVEVDAQPYDVEYDDWDDDDTTDEEEDEVQD
jgi:hypothetical protein